MLWLRILILLVSLSHITAEEYSWGWINMNPEGDIPKIKKIIEPLLKAANLPSGYMVGINLDSSQDLKVLHINIHRLSTGKFPNTFTGTDNKQYDAVIWVDYQIPDSDSSYAYIVKYFNSTMALLPRK